MKIRVGFVTNSSSTNFLILSKKELTAEFLYSKLGFKKSSIIYDQAMQLCQDIVNGTCDGLRWYDIDTLDEKHIEEMFGKKAARIYCDTKPKGFYAYLGHTESDEGALTCFFTTDSFEISEKDFYLNARECVW